MSPEQFDMIYEQASSPINVPVVPEEVIKGFLMEPEPEKQTTAFAENLMRSNNAIELNTTNRKDVTGWIDSRQHEFTRATEELAGTDRHTSDATDHKTFKIAFVNLVIGILSAAVVVIGSGALLNSVSSPIISSGEVATLVSFWTAWPFSLAIIMVVLVTKGHYHLIHLDKDKKRFRNVLYALCILVGIVWLILEPMAFPMNGDSSVANDNMFAAAEHAEKVFDPLTWFFPIHILLEVLGGSSLGIFVVHIFTRGHVVKVTANPVYEKNELDQRDILQDLTTANRVLGKINDYQAIYTANVATFIAACLTCLRKHGSKRDFLHAAADHEFFLESSLNDKDNDNA